MGQKEYLGSRTGEVEGGKPILALLCTGADTSQTARPRATGAPSHSELSLTMPSSSSTGQQGACLPQKVMGTWCHLPSLMGVCRWLLLPSPLEAWLTGPWPSGTGRVTLPVTEGTLSPLYPIIITPPPPTSRAVDHTLWPWCGQSGCFEEGPGHFSVTSCVVLV